MSVLFETGRLIVRELVAGDVDAMVAIFGDRQVAHWLGDGQPLDRLDCRDWITRSRRNYRERGYGVSAVVRRDDGAMIGCCGIIHADGGPGAEIIYALRRDCWGQGYGREMVEAMLDYGVGHCDLPVIYATIDPENAASQRILERAGMVWLHTGPDEEGLPTATWRLERMARSSTAGNRPRSA